MNLPNRSAVRRALWLTGAVVLGSLAGTAAVLPAATADPSTREPGVMLADQPARAAVAQLAAAQADYSWMMSRDGQADYADSVDQLQDAGLLPDSFGDGVEVAIEVRGSVTAGGESFTALAGPADGEQFRVSNRSFEPVPVTGR